MEREISKIENVVWYFVYLNNAYNKRRTEYLKNAIKQLIQKYSIITEDATSGVAECFAEGGVTFNMFLKNYEAPLGGASNLLGYEITSFGKYARSNGRV